MKLRKSDCAIWQNKSPMKWLAPERNWFIHEKFPPNRWRSKASLSTALRAQIKYHGCDSRCSNDKISSKWSSLRRISSHIMCLAQTSIWILILKCRNCRVFILHLRNFQSAWQLCWTTVFSKCTAPPKWSPGLLAFLMRTRPILPSSVCTFVSKTNSDIWFILLLISISSQRKSKRSTTKRKAAFQNNCYKSTSNKRWWWSKEEEITSSNSKRLTQTWFCLRMKTQESSVTCSNSTSKS